MAVFNAAPCCTLTTFVSSTTQHEHPRGKDNPGMLAIHQLIESKVAEQKEKLTMLQIATDDVYFMSDDVSEK